jgi:hypothetical protein
MIRDNKPKSITIALNCQVIGQYVFDDLTVLFDFQFDDGMSFEEFSFFCRRSRESLAF